MLKGKTIIVGVSSSIAIFKACELVSQLRQKGANVYVLMTPNATKLIAPLTFQALSGNSVVFDLFEPKEEAIQHVGLADRANVMVIAPATANIIAKLANGIADDALSTTALACRAPLIISPAMETKMWEHPATQKNIQILRERGTIIVEPEEGWLASGKSGKGRMASIDKIIAEIERALTLGQDLLEWKVLVTAGATREPIDAVRFISNPSSGKMGVVIAQVAKERGANVILVAGHMEVNPPEEIKVEKVKTAEEMLKVVLKYVDWFDVLVSAAAIADFKPKKVSEGKIRRSETKNLVLELEPTPDLLATVRQYRPDAFLVGFAAELGEPIKGAQEKLKRKGLNLIVANDVTQPNSGFGVDTNRCVFISDKGLCEALPLLTKREVAERMWDKIKELRNKF
ncbi:MAG: bifunctional phosphopantothenoylcysteine decarboxylase/phosphopantothenate--cysteine ligase CoaBC [Armatimonadetes bacterium]|nr:bifunctional phosphopantothenoylcysteine decarboxylase/phosphopantothenate--cysteine ligase CoaBC [Armatimonadota bacterium]